MLGVLAKLKQFLTSHKRNMGGEMKNSRTLIFMIVMINAGGYNEEPVDQDEILSNLNHLNDLRSKPGER
jgi:hypothetical protein